ncbi:MAG: hypothetical protein F4Z18_15260 [Caldilineaceae bacterium SB0666_bin_21]|nr:hypothetical protein [Caldilineaceae bacterium SB0666_bin_21]
MFHYRPQGILDPTNGIVALLGSQCGGICKFEFFDRESGDLTNVVTHDLHVNRRTHLQVLGRLLLFSIALAH